MIDKNGKLFGKINIIDLFVIIMFLVLTLAIVFRSQSVLQGREKGTIEYRIQIEGVREFAAPYYKEGLMVYDKLTSSAIGKITNVEVIPFRDRLSDKDGVSIMSEKPAHVSVILTLEAPVEVSDESYLAYGNYEIKAGSNIELKTKYTEAMTKVKDVIDIKIEK